MVMRFNSPFEEPLHFWGSLSINSLTAAPTAKSRYSLTFSLVSPATRNVNVKKSNIVFV